MPKAQWIDSVLYPGELETCVKCKGEGRDWDNEHWKKCPICDGKGCRLKPKK